MKLPILLLALALVAPAQTATKKQDGKPAKQTEKADKVAMTIPAAQIPGRHEVLRNKKVIVSTVELEPGTSMPMHRHERDYLAVVLTAGQMRETVADQNAAQSGGKKVGRMFSALHVPGASGDKFQAGEVVYNQAGYTHAEENKGKTAMRAVSVEFLEAAGKRSDQNKSNKYCNPDNKKLCVEEKYLFCTDKFCVEDVTMDPGAMSTRHSHSSDHLLVAVTDYRLLDDISAGNPGIKGKKTRVKKAGEAEYIASGITHQLTNTGPQAARFIVVAFK